MKKRSWLCLLFGALLSGSPPAQAWSLKGHVLVARIAERMMAPDRLRRVEALLGSHPSEVVASHAIPGCATRFQAAAVWPDRINRIEHGSMHYCDKAYSADGTPDQPDIPEENVVVGIPQMIAQCRSAAQDSERAAAVCFLIHFVGDIHQPLHCTTRVDREHTNGDDGGNDWAVYAGDSTVRTTFHHYWDSAAGLWESHRGEDTAAELDRLTQLALGSGLSEADLEALVQRNRAEEWAAESHQAAIEIAYPGLKPGQNAIWWVFEHSRRYVPDGKPLPFPAERFSKEYTKQVRGYCLRRVNLAGRRLAKLLDSLF